ncbi:MAG: hypothetical protein QGF12_04620, partial [SAR202 cluster bacterium]|nr:hypothetical protein [SAR202 cluster bacterium]
EPPPALDDPTLSVSLVAIVTPQIYRADPGKTGSLVDQIILAVSCRVSRRNPHDGLVLCLF